MRVLPIVIFVTTKLSPFLGPRPYRLGDGCDSLTRVDYAPFIRFGADSYTRLPALGRNEVVDEYCV